MKREYNKPIVEKIVFSYTDVSITAGPGKPGPGPGPGPGPNHSYDDNRGHGGNCFWDEDHKP